MNDLYYNSYETFFDKTKAIRMVLMEGNLQFFKLYKDIKNPFNTGKKPEKACYKGWTLMQSKTLARNNILILAHQLWQAYHINARN